MEFQVLGAVRVARDGAPVAVPGALQRTLLAVLLCRAGAPVPVDVLTAALWPDDITRSGPQRLQVHVHRLRRLLDEPDRIVHTDDSYRLVVDPGELDVARFESLADDAATHTGTDPERGATLARAALRLWRGVPFDGLDVPLLADEARRLTERWLATAELRYEADLRCGRHADIVAELVELAAAHPLRERLCGLLMTALYRSGRQADALAVHRATRRTLIDELGLEPGPELRAIESQILAGGVVELDAPPPHLVVPAQLPADVPDFVGRDAELSILDEQLAARTARTGVLTGTAGVGKTALVVHWAHRNRGAFPDGQLYVDLSGYGPGQAVEPADALAGFLRALGVEVPQIPADPAERAARFRSLVDGRRLLVVLDNARSADQVRPLLPGGPTCVVLVTSRDTLGGLVARDGARRIGLDRFELTEALALLRRLTGARADAEPDAAVELTERCAGLPLALRIAAESLTGGGLRIADLVGELRGDQHRLDALDTSGDPHTEIRTVFSWSYRRLPAEAARLFRLFGLHPGRSATADALAALADRSRRETRRALEPLLRAHLLEEDTRGRYGTHDLLQAYATECAAEDETAASRDCARRRLYAWYLHRAVDARRVVGPQSPVIPLDGIADSGPVIEFADAGAAVAWHERERAALVSVVRAAAERGEHGVAWRLATALLNFFNLSKHWDDWIGTHLVGLDSARRADDPVGEACILNGLGVAYDDLCRFDEAIECHDRASVLFERAGEHHRQAWNLNNVGVVYDRCGRFTEALDRHREALVLFRAAGDTRGESFSLNNLGDVHRQRGEYAEAEDYLLRALALQRAAGRVQGLSYTLCTLGDLNRDLGRIDAAIDHYGEALEVSRLHNDRWQAAMLLTRIADLHRVQDRVARAEEHLRDALELLTQVGDIAAVEDVRARLAELGAVS